MAAQGLANDVTNTQRRDGVPEQYMVLTQTMSMRKNGKGQLKTPKVTEMWRPQDKDK